MPTTSAAAPQLTNETKDKNRVYYPAAQAFFVVAFENYDLKNPDRGRGFTIIPKRFTIHINSYHKADEFEIVCDADRFPVTPESVRAGGVEIRLFQTEGLDEQQRDPRFFQVDGVRPTITGLFDDLSLSFSDTGREVRATGKDYTALFVAKDYDRKTRVSAGKTLDVALTQLMKAVPGAEEMRVTVESDEGMPVLGRDDGAVNRKYVRLNGKTYWDVMYELADRYGFKIFVRGLEVIVTKPHYYESLRSDPYSLSWGDNIFSIEASRKMAKERVPVVRVRSYDSKKRITHFGEFPKDKQQVRALSTGGADNPEVEVLTFTLPGITSKKVLERAAQTYHNLVGRGEQTLVVETRDLRDLNGKDMLQLDVGMPVSISFRPYTLDLLENLPFEERVGRLVSLYQYPQDVASKISEAIERTNFFRRPMRVKEITYDWDVESGLNITLELQNYVNVDLVENKE
jgi:hypothetical protein